MSTEFKPGLEGVTAGITAISEVDAERNRLIYRGYDVHDLLEHCSFEEVAYLLLYGKLPNTGELADFKAQVAQEGEVLGQIFDLYRQMPRDSHPMDTLKAAVAMLALFDPDRDENDHEANQRKALRLFAKMPNLVVNGYRILCGQQPIQPGSGLDHNQSFFQMLTGSPADPYFAKVMNVTQILYAEHGFNASTFAARVTVSTLSDLYSGVVSAIGTLKGPLHGGANEAAMAMLEEIGDVTNAAPWVRDALAKKKKIMGFGHREYKHGDERAKIVKGYVVELGQRLGNNKWQTR
jgi:citrate synthase